MSLFENIRGTLGNIFSMGKGTNTVDLRTNSGILEARDNNGGYIPIVKMHTETSTPKGFVSNTDSNISFTNSTRVFSISPVSTQYVIYSALSQRYIKTTSETITVPNTTGSNYIYFDSSGVLRVTTDKYVFYDNVQVAYVYYNATTGVGFLGDERHKAAMDSPTLNNLQNTNGMLYGGGLDISGYILDNATIQGITFALSAGNVIAEDLVFSISAKTQPTYVPVVYRSGTDGNWNIDTATDHPFKMSGNYIAYNRYDGSQWLQTPMSEKYYVSYWLIATNCPQYPLIMVQGQKASATFAEATLDRLDTLVLGNYPLFSQTKVLYRLVYQSSSTFNPSSYYSKLQGVVGLRNNVFTDINGYSPISHCSLTNVDSCGHPASVNYANSQAVATGTSQSIASKTYTTVSFPTESIDIANEMSSTTFTSSRRQLVYVYFIGSLTGFPVSKDFVIHIVKGASTVICSRICSSVQGGSISLSASVLTYLAAGDTIHVEVYNGSSSSVNIINYTFAAYTVGGIKA